MSGAHYIAGLPRSRSPSPVPTRRRQSTTDSVYSSDRTEDTKEPDGEEFGGDGRPRRNSFRRSFCEGRPSRASFREPRNVSPHGDKQSQLVRPRGKSDIGLTNIAFTEDLQPRASFEGHLDYRQKGDDHNNMNHLRVELPTGPYPKLQVTSEDTPPDTGLPFVKSQTPIEVIATIENPTAHASNTELRQPSEFRGRFTSPKSEMSHLTTSTPRKNGYGSLNEHVVIAEPESTINGDPDTPTSFTSEAFDVNNQGRTEFTRLLSESSGRASYYTPAMVDELRKRNRLYFLDPITKLMHFHGFPWKLTLQIAKVVLITVQIVIFGGQRQSIVEFFERSNLAFKHLLLKDWDIAFETMPYPPAAGQYAIYEMEGLFSHMNFAMEQYHKLPHMSLAAVRLNRDSDKVPYPVQLCFTANDVKNLPNNTYIVRASVIQNCTNVYPEEGKLGNFTYDIKKFIDRTNFTIIFNRTLELSLQMYVRTYHLNLLETHYGPTCYNDSLKIVYSNNERSGQILITMESLPTEIDCESQKLSNEVTDETNQVQQKVISIDGVVIGICILSTILCARSLKRSNRLRHDTSLYFKRQRDDPLSCSDHLEYINMWYVVIICNDVLTIIGSCFKIQLESRVYSISSANYELCSILLGLGVLLTYVGILRYLGFFKSYNVLILTLKTSFPHVLRFLVCAVCLYIGFLFCGWVIFSPYNIKFRKLSSASECLFSLVNGDDMFVSFSALTTNSNAIWYVNRAYLYIFISLFIYVVISVFIAVIMDNYENLKKYYEGTRPDTIIQAFMKEDGEMPLTEVFSHVSRTNSCQAWFFCFFPCLACLRTSPPIKREDPMCQQRQATASNDDLMQDVF